MYDGDFGVFFGEVDAAELGVLVVLDVDYFNCGRGCCLWCGCRCRLCLALFGSSFDAVAFALLADFDADLDARLRRFWHLSFRRFGSVHVVTSCEWVLRVFVMKLINSISGWFVEMSV